MPNALIHENSPYLLRAAQQLVRWLPWSESAFQKAREENKVVLLSIGASWCHWCHVMDRESYADPEIAELINESFVAIKLDRDEHPEVDRRYQAALATLNGEGGWPLTAFLTSDGSLFAGGTYMPPDTRFGQKGLRTLLREIQESARTAGPSLQASAEQIRRMQEPATVEPAELSTEFVENMVRLLVRDFDFGHGGFGEAPRFPHPPALEVLLAASFRSRDQNQENLVRKALECMARGGIYDQLAGGFHRYATDEAWSVPHFEKLLGDNAELLKLYTRAFTFTENPLYKETAEGIFKWVKTVMTDREGGFFNSQDADTGTEDDGGYYTWTPEDAQNELTEKEMQVVSAYYNIRNAAAGNILHNDRSIEDISEEFKIPVTIAGSLLAAGKEKLYWARKKRLEPETDPVLYVHSNAQMFSALLEAGHSLLLNEARDLAYKSLDRLLALAWTPEEGFAHSITAGKAHLRGLLEDQVFGGIALLDAHADSEDPLYLERAVQTARVLQQMHEDPLNGGFFDIAADAGRASCLAPEKPFQDSPTPAGNSTAAIFFLRLYSLTSDNAHLEAAERTLQSAAGRVKDWGVFAGTFVLALQYLLEGEFQVFIVGESQHPDAESLRQAAWQSYRPRKQIQRLDPDVDVMAPAIQGMVEFIRRKRKPMAFVCVQGSCAAPVEEPDDLRKLMLTFNP